MIYGSILFYLICFQSNINKCLAIFNFKKKIDNPWDSFSNLIS